MAFFNFFKKKKDENIAAEEAINENIEVNYETEQDDEVQPMGVDKDTEPEYEETNDPEEVLEENNTAVDVDTEQAEDTEPTEEENNNTENVEEEHTEVKKTSFFSRIKSGLKKTRDNILSGVEQVLKGFSEIDDELYEELEEALIMADIGVDTSLEIIAETKKIVKDEKIKEVSEVKNVIIRVISDMLTKDDEPLELPDPSVILVIGVNGVGKTTTIGKLTNYYKAEGKSVILAAADTFRAAAIDQLAIWGERNNVTVIKHGENSDPAAVVFDAVAAAKNRNTNLLICDTAGRLHNKKNLMEELKKISRVITRENESAHKEVFLVLDATTGQNALQQAKLFKEATDITGIVLTKLDGTAKGGIVIAIKNELNIPVRFIGVGEGIDDLRPFDPAEFAKALFEE